MIRRLVLIAAATLAMAGAARAEVTDRSPAGFEIQRVLQIAAPRAKVWEALLQPARWWEPSHSWTGNAANLSMDFERECFCETLPKGRARHMAIVYSDGEKALRLFGGLGPLQFTGASGHLRFDLADVAAGGTRLTLTYSVGGYAKGGLAEAWAAPVDGVLGVQTERLKRYVETGTP